MSASEWTDSASMATLPESPAAMNLAKVITALPLRAASTTLRFPALMPTSSLRYRSIACSIRSASRAVDFAVSTPESSSSSWPVSSWGDRMVTI